jgi:hypothetical protein
MAGPTTSQLDPLNQDMTRSAFFDPMQPPNQLGNSALAVTYVNYWKEMQRRRVYDAQKMWDWYYNDKERILFHVRRAMMKMFKQETVNRMNVRVLNVVYRVVNKICMVYKQPPQRELNGGTTAEVSQKTIAGKKTAEVVDNPDKENEQYQEMIASSTIANKAKEWHRLGRLFNTVLVQPVWVPDPNEAGEGFMDFNVHTPAWCIVKSDQNDYLRPESFYYPRWVTIDGIEQQVLVFWDAKSHFYIDRVGNKRPLPDNPQMTNPYGLLPAAVLRFSEGIDFWGEGLWDLIDVTEEVAVQLSNLAYVGIFQGHGQAVAINMNLPQGTVIGPDRPLTVDNAGGSAESATPSFSFAHPQADLKGLQDMIDWLLKDVQAIKGLAPESFSTQVRLASGVAKMQDNMDIEELRQDDIAILQNFEEDLFEVMARIWNVHNPGKKIDEEADFSISFADQKVTKTAQEKVLEREFGLTNGTVSRLDIIMEDDPTLTDEDAREKLKQILAENKQWEDKYGLFGDEEPEPAPAQPAIPVAPGVPPANLPGGDFNPAKQPAVPKGSGSGDSNR